VIALAALVAAVIIPIASGAADKTYTLAVSPGSACAGANTTVTLTNTAKTVTLGSAEIYFPVGSIQEVSAGTLRNDATRDTIANLHDLNLGKNASLQIIVTLKSTASFTAPITAVVKQSNNFNDSGGTANLFDNPTFPQMTVSVCKTVSGLVWRDKNEDTSVSSDTSAEPRQGGWTISAYPVGSATAAATTTSSSTAGSVGTFSVKLPIGSAYWLCEKKPANSGTWAQSTPASTPSAPTQCDSDTPNAIRIPASGTLSADLPGQNFGNLATTTVTCNNASTSNDGTSQVQPSVQCKASGEYVFDAWTQDGAQYVALHPASGTYSCVPPFTGANCQFFVQKITWTGLSNAQDPLQYDDNPTSHGLSYESMLFCQKDPRSGDLALTNGTVPTDVLPTAARSDGDPSTSCLITSTNSVSPTGVRQRIDYVFTVSDGYGKVG